MDKPRLGCLTRSGVIAALLALLSIVLFGFVGGGALFSPGALNAQQSGAVLGGVRSHAETNGNCGACHTAPWDAAAMADRCTACHADVATQMRQVATLHGQLAQTDSAVLACYDCHPDHRGPNASLVDMTDKTFPHTGVGFSLQGHVLNTSGAAFTCKDCHPTDIKTFDAQTCADCHGRIDAAFTQAHLVAYGQACLNCHDGVDRFGKQFTHESFAFKLAGKHAGVSCEKCHNGVLTLAGFAATPQDCFSCHKQADPHGGRFGQDCSACHTVEGWQPATFDHNLASFKLTGAHASVACDRCHANNVFKGTPNTCVGCHQDPAWHAGVLGTDCATCHTTTAWSPAQFNRSHPSFGEEGGIHHGGATCTTCHPNNVITYTCLACHSSNNPTGN